MRLLMHIGGDFGAELGYASIEKYARGMRTFQQLHHYTLGRPNNRRNWLRATFMAAVKVHTWAPACFAVRFLSPYSRSASESHAVIASKMFRLSS